MNKSELDLPRTQKAVFQYTGKQAFIKIIERQSSEGQGQILQSYVTDSQFSIIKSKEKQRITLNYYQQYPQISNIIYEIKQFKKKVRGQKHHYKKYPQLFDLDFGRKYWGRSQNSIKINSNNISRHHCKLFTNKAEVDHQFQIYQSFLLQPPKNIWKTAYPSLWDIPFEIKSLIISFLDQKPSYFIEDLASRTGTYLQIPKSKFLEQQYSYQFPQKSYQLKILSIFSGNNTDIENYYTELLEKQSQDFSYSYEKNKLLTIVNDKYSIQELFQVEYKFNAILIEINFFDKSQKIKILLISPDGTQTENQIGDGKQIELNERNHDDFFSIHRLDGRIVLKNQQWFIEGANSEIVWMKLPINVPYKLKTHEKNILRLNQTVEFDIQFNNMI